VSLSSHHYPQVIDGANGRLSPPFDLRPGRPGDEVQVLDLLDEAVVWLNARGITAQWGTEPFSRSTARVDAARRWVASGGTVLATGGASDADESAAMVAGALVLGDAPDYVPASDRPEVYVVLLVAGRSPAARGVGAYLLDHARTVAEARGVDRVRVDCYAGGDRSLVRFYEANGFIATHTFRVGDWPGQVLEQPLRGRVG
jgi:GNAT superfamily N-acetyltransferase